MPRLGDNKDIPELVPRYEGYVGGENGGEDRRSEYEAVDMEVDDQVNPNFEVDSEVEMDDVEEETAEVDRIGGDYLNDYMVAEVYWNWSR